MIEETTPFSFFYGGKGRGTLFTWPSESVLYFKNYSLCLLTGNRRDLRIEDFFDRMKEISFKKRNLENEVFHLFYESGLYLNGLINNVDKKTPLAIYCRYRKKNITKPLKHFKKIALSLKQRPIYGEYRKKFKTIMSHLLDGDCYQVNYSLKYFWEIKEEVCVEDFLYLFGQEHINQYGHLTWIPLLEKLYLSNSPEGLFSWEKIRNQKNSFVYAMPIKGTTPLINSRDILKAKKYLLSSVKERSELNMITDLILNDLSRIEMLKAKLVKQYHHIVVPFLLHQCSISKAELSEKIKLYDIVRALFPSGSITGAPKIKVMEIISCLENHRRGMYCGSTILSTQEGPIKGSVNIRSAEISLKDSEMVTCSGAGLTLLSSSINEFDEIERKNQSFMKTFY